MKGLYLLIGICCLALLFAIMGCSKPILKMEADVATFMKDNTLSNNCKAGIAAAAILAPDTDASVRIAAQAVSVYADKESQDYKDCFTKTAFFSFAVRGGIDEIGKISSQLITLGILP